MIAEKMKKNGKVFDFSSKDPSEKKKIEISKAYQEKAKEGRVGNKLKYRSIDKKGNICYTEPVPDSQNILYKNNNKFC